MGLFEAHEEKKQDIRVIDRARSIGKLDRKANDVSVSQLADDAERAIYVNTDEINARDNPVHVSRNLPTLEVVAPRNIEDLEFDSDEANRGFEQ